MSKEMWKDYLYIYQVSNMGRIRNKETGYILKMTKWGEYYRIKLKDENGKGHIVTVHIAVAKAFIPNPNNLPVINHKDGNKFNNKASNLEWTTYSENTKHAVKTGLLKTKSHKKRRQTTPLPVIDKKGEIWKPYFYNYSISNYGRLKNHKTNRLLRARLNKRTGYIEYCAKPQNKNYRSIKLHRAVAELFVPNPYNKPIVNHIDGNKQNNIASNLEWVTEKENTAHAFSNGLIKQQGYTNTASKLNNKEVQYIRKHYIAKDKNFGANALAKKFRVSTGTIWGVVTRKYYK